VHVVAVRSANGQRLDGNVGVPGVAGDLTLDLSGPQLMPIPSFSDAPADPVGPGEMSDQAMFVNTSLDPGWPLNSTRIYARCFGQSASIAIHIDTNSPAQIVRIPCDDREHVVDGPGFLPAGTSMDTTDLYHGQKGIAHTVEISPNDDETAWRAVVVAR